MNGFVRHHYIRYKSRNCQQVLLFNFSGYKYINLSSYLNNILDTIIKINGSDSHKYHFLFINYTVYIRKTKSITFTEKASPFDSIL